MAISIKYVEKVHSKIADLKAKEKAYQLQVLNPSPEQRHWYYDGRVYIGTLSEVLDLILDLWDPYVDLKPDGFLRPATHMNITPIEAVEIV